MDSVGEVVGLQSVTLLIEMPFLESLRSRAVERTNVHRLFDLLLKREFVGEMEEGRYLIAPSLWALADAIDKLSVSQPNKVQIAD